MNLVSVFLTGLFTGGLTCMAVQGGLLAATLAQKEEERLKDKTGHTGNILPVLSFLLAKLVSYTILGMLLGYFGSFFQLSITSQVVLQVFVAVFMIGTALNLLEVHPVFRYFAIKPPKFLMKIVRNESKSKSIFAPALVGAFTVFVPCGTTQAMMALSIGSADPLIGGAIMFSFILGTSPTFFLLGFAAAKLGDILKGTFSKLAAAAIILLALFNLNSALMLSGSSFTFDQVIGEVKCTIFSVCDNQAVNMKTDTGAVMAVETAEIKLEDSGYSPNEITVKAGSKVTLTLNNINARGCIQSFTIPKVNVQKIVRTGTKETVEFIAPMEKGNLAFMCGMGMYRGNIRVI